MFYEKLNCKVEEMSELLDSVQNQEKRSSLQADYIEELAKNWTVSKRIHAAERGRLKHDSNQVQAQYRSLFFQANFSKVK